MEEWTQPQTSESPAWTESATATLAGQPTPFSTPAAPKAGLKKKILMGVGGLAVVAVAAGVLVQVFAVEPGIAKTDDDPKQTSSKPRYMARVNTELITWEAVAEECVARYGKDVLDSLINRMIVQQACQEKGIEVTEQEVEAEIIRIATQFNMPKETWYQMLQSERSLSEQQYKRDIIWPMLALKKLAGEQVQITNNDIFKEYNRQYGARVKVKVLMVENIRHAQTLHEQITRSPQDFERLVREHSIEPNSRALDGAIPPIHRHYPNEKLEEAAFALKQGEISGIIEVGVRRYVILKSEGVTEPKKVDPETVKGELYQQLQEQRVQELVAKTFNTLKQEARVDNFLTNTTTGGVRPVSGTQQPNQVQPAEGIYNTQSQQNTGANQQSPFQQ